MRSGRELMRLGIIGATGWLGSALVRGLTGSDLAPASGLVLLNRSGARPPGFDHPEVGWAEDASDLTDRTDAIVLSVRPEDYPALALWARGRLVISLMAGVRMTTLSASGARVVRAMPNAAAEHGRSYTPWLASDDVTEADRAFVRALLARIGTEDEVPNERSIDYLTGLSGSGAAYPALMAAAMLADARAAGLSELVARRAVEAAVCGGAEMLRNRIETADDYLTAYKDYRGTTAAGLEAAERAGFPAAVRAALAEAAQKAWDMGATVEQ